MTTKQWIYILFCLGFALSCRQSSKDPTTTIIANIGSQAITLSEVDRYLLSLPESQRWRPENVDFSTWIENQIRMLALRNYLAASDAMQHYMAQPETEVRRRFIRAQLLESMLINDLATEVEPSKEKVAERAKKIADRHGSGPLLSFQHIYFRIDQGRNRNTIRTTAETVASDAQKGADFTTLVRTHSDSVNAEAGGIVQNVRGMDLDKATRDVLATLNEGDVSRVIESRSGLHIFRLVRRFQPRQPQQNQLSVSARTVLIRERLAARQKELLANLHQRIDIHTEHEPWQVGSFSADAGFRRQVIASKRKRGIPNARSVIDFLLLAQEALDRGLGAETVEQQVEDSLKMGFLEQLINERRRQLDAELPAEQLRTFYDAEPTRFAIPERLGLNLIFVPQGKDSLATQRRLEAHVADLRNGASFGDLARTISTGPGAQQDGYLGLLKPNEWTSLGPAVAAVIPKLKPGDISDPIYCTGRIMTANPYLLKGGFAIVGMIERIPERPRSFDESIQDVRLAYASQHRADLDNELKDLILGTAGFKIKRLPLAEELAR